MLLDPSASPQHYIFCSLQDELIEYHNQHKKFPGAPFTLPKHMWANVIVTMWICLCSIPLFLLTLYLAWVGQWLTLGITVLAIILGELLTMLFVVYSIDL